MNITIDQFGSCDENKDKYRNIFRYFLLRLRASTLVSVYPLNKRVYIAILHIHNPCALFRAQ
jgi:hypothetical protein